MQYLGGKSKIRKQIATFLRSVRKPGQVYFEPFVGGGWVMQEMDGPRVASDGNPALVAMYQAVQEGWEPPEWVSEEEYRRLAARPIGPDPMQAFALIGCSFAGKWGGGYARSVGKPCYAATTRRSLLKQRPMLAGVRFECRLFQDWHPEGWLVYADPPYTGMTSYGAFEGFDHEGFWRTMAEWAERNTVVVSEYQAPEGWGCVAEFQSQMGMSSGDAQTRTKRTECIFMRADQAREMGVGGQDPDQSGANLPESALDKPIADGVH